MLAGCGEDEKFTAVEQGGERAAKVLAAAPGKTRAERTARLAMSVSSSGTSIIHATGISRLDRERTRLELTYDVAAGDLPAGTKAVVLADGNEGYVRFQNGHRWVHVPAGGADPTFSTGVSQSLYYLSSVVGNARFLKEETLRGEPVRVYAATIDIGRVADHLPPGERATYREKSSKAGLPNRLPLTVAIDRKGRITRMVYGATVRGNKLAIQFELFDFGARGGLSLPKRFVEAGP